MATVDPTGPGLTFATSDVRLAGAVRKMKTAHTVPALVAIKDAAKPTLLPRDLPKLKAAFAERLQYLRSIPTTPSTTTEGQP